MIKAVIGKRKNVANIEEFLKNSKDFYVFFVQTNLNLYIWKFFKQDIISFWTEKMISEF